MSADTDLQAYLDGHAAEIDEKLATFAESATLFSSNKPRFIDKYENKWVAAHDGTVVAVADSLNGIMALIDSKGISPADTMIRHIDREEKSYIL